LLFEELWEKNEQLNSDFWDDETKIFEHHKITIAETTNADFAGSRSVTLDIGKYAHVIDTIKVSKKSRATNDITSHKYADIANTDT